MFQHCMSKVKRTNPLVHCITNEVTINDCANVLLACGGSPIMADEKREVEDMQAICQALVINIGTLNERTVESMILAGKQANRLGHPVVLDPVGAGATAYRTLVVKQLLEAVNFAVIRGNISEIKTVFAGAGSTMGVDANGADLITEDKLDQAFELACAVSQRTGAVCVITGSTDIVAKGKQAYLIHNGHGRMSKVTGTGCMLTAVIGAYVGACEETAWLEAVATAVAVMGLSGQRAALRCEGLGHGSFRVAFIDEISLMDEGILGEVMKFEQR